MKLFVSISKSAEQLSYWFDEIFLCDGPAC